MPEMERKPVGSEKFRLDDTKIFHSTIEAGKTKFSDFLVLTDGLKRRLNGQICRKMSTPKIRTGVSPPHPFFATPLLLNLPTKMTSLGKGGFTSLRI